MPQGSDAQTTGAARIKRLSWLCRRGMKELDVLLERFVTEQRSALERGEWPGLEKMLGAEDDALWDWLQNPESVEGDSTRRLLSEIRNERS
jgi:antitoxin CptB